MDATERVPNFTLAKSICRSTFRCDDNVRGHWNGEPIAFCVASDTSFNRSHDRLEPVRCLTRQQSSCADSRVALGFEEITRRWNIPFHQMRLEVENWAASIK